MSQQVRKGEELNEFPLKKFLQSSGLIEDVRQVLEVIQFTHGFSNLTYLLRIEGKEMVLRQPPKGAIRRGHDMGREYKVLSRLHKVFNKAPKALAYTENETIIGAPFYIMQKKEGIILSIQEVLQRNISPEAFSIISNNWLDTLIELHQVDYKNIGLRDLGKPDGYVERQVSNWGKQYLYASTEEVPAAHKVMKWMENNQPKNYDSSMIHNDYKYDNIVFADDTWQSVSAVLDWEMCTLGDPLMDLGTSLAYWSMESDGDMIKKGIPSPTIFPGNPSRTDIVQSYATKSGRNVDHLVFYYVFGLFKVAVIAQQIYHRFKKGLTTDPRFAKLNKSSAFLCTMALQAIEQDRIEDLF